MKELPIEKMEMVSGGDMDQRNCMIAGGVIVIGLFVSIVAPVYGVPLAAGAALAGMSGNCF